MDLSFPKNPVAVEMFSSSKDSVPLVDMKDFARLVDSEDLVDFVVAWVEIFDPVVVEVEEASFVAGVAEKTIASLVFVDWVRVLDSCQKEVAVVETYFALAVVWADLD